MGRWLEPASKKLELNLLKFMLEFLGSDGVKCAFIQSGKIRLTVNAVILPSGQDAH